MKTKTNPNDGSKSVELSTSDRKLLANAASLCEDIARTCSWGGHHSDTATAAGNASDALSALLAGMPVGVVPVELDEET